MNTILATIPELAVKRVLDKLGVHYEFQSKMLGGRDVKGGAVIDFFLPDYGIGISIIGEYWHENRPDTQMRDRMQRLALEGQGIRVVYISATDALRNARYYVEEALKGISHYTLS